VFVLNPLGEDFFTLIVEDHIVAAVMPAFDMSAMDGMHPS